MKKNEKEILNLELRAKQIRRTILEIAYKTKTGHIAPALSIVDILNILYTSVLKINRTSINSQNRDRFILSKGHAALALYVVLAMNGFFSIDEVLTYCQNGGTFGVHPDFDTNLGIEFTTGSLGHGLSVATGMALGLKIEGKSSRVYVLVSDAELNEGSVWEAIMFAAHHKLDNLVMIIDDNSLQAFGKTEDVLNIKPLKNKFESFNWSTKTINGHNYKELLDVFESISQETGKPKVVIAETIGGKGVSFMEGKIDWHYNNLTQELYKKAIEQQI